MLTEQPVHPEMLELAVWNLRGAPWARELWTLITVINRAAWTSTCTQTPGRGGHGKWVASHWVAACPWTSGGSSV